MTSIVEGQTIVSEGEIVEEEDITTLERLGLMEREVNWTRYLYIALIVLVLTSMIGLYLYRFEAVAFNNIKKVLIIAIFLTVFTVIIKGLNTLAAIHLNLWNYLFPVIALSMLMTVIFDARVGIILTICIGFFAGIATNLDFSLTIAYMVGGFFLHILCQMHRRGLQSCAAVLLLH